MYTATSSQLLRTARLVALFGFLLVLEMLGAEAPRISFDIPSGDARPMLRMFATQSKHEIVFPVELVAAVKTRAIKGEMFAREALDAMLAETGLAAFQDDRTGAFAIRREGDEKNANRRRAGSPAAIVEGQVVRLQAVEVTGSRLRGLLGGATAQPILAFDSKDIERTGAQSLGDLFRYIPQVSSFTLGQSVTKPTGFVSAPGGPTIPTFNNLNTGASSRTTATLRGTAGDGTLLLVDGRRVPKNNQASGGDGYDLNGIPLAAIERIEVLLDGASSIYGADAIGGVINVILKHNYRGTEVRFAYENTLDKDAGVLTASLTHGFGSGKLRGLLTLSREEANSMALRDRWFTASYDRRPFGGLDLRGTVIGDAGRVSRTGTVPLPGLTTTSAAVPSGTNGLNLTQADYAKAGAVPEPGDLAQFQAFGSSYARTSGVMNLSYSFHPWLEAYTEVRAARNRNQFATQPIQAALSIPAGYPGNPFGIPVILSKYFYDVAPVRTSTDETLTAALGARGRLPRDWRYDASIGYVRGQTDSGAGAGASISSAQFNAAVAAGQMPNLFYDSSRVANPNAPGVLESLTLPIRDEEITESWIYSLQADGPIWTLPAGKVALAAGTEYREEYTDFPLRAATDIASARAANQEVTAFFSEINVPVFAPAQKYPLLNQLNVSGSFRRESYSAGGESSNPRGGLAWRPAKWMLLRGSYGEGFKVPTMLQSNQPAVTSNFRFSGSVDPLRGNEAQTTFISRTTGGNPDLRPEKSENTNLGLVIEAPFTKGLSFSADWFDNKFIDRITLPTFEQMLLYFPERVTRGTNLPTDQPDWAGPVKAIDYRNVNLAYSEVRGYDLSVRLDRTTPWGDLLVNLTGTKYTRNVFVAAPNAAPSASVSTDSLPVQVSGSAFFNRGVWGSGILATYRASNRALTTVAATPSAIRWDWQFSYDFDKADWARSLRDHWYGRALKGIKLSLTVFNLLNTRPPFDYLYLPDNTTLDARLRRYALSLRKQF